MYQLCVDCPFLWNALSLQLGLPRSTVRVLKLETKKEDTAAVEEVIMEDKAAGRLPIMCIANVHSAIFQVRLLWAAF
jgi:hypothetical protein